MFSIVLFEVEESDRSGTIEVSYHITKGDQDLVHRFRSYRDKLLRREPSHHGVTVDGVQFIPRAETLMVSILTHILIWKI